MSCYMESDMFVDPCLFCPLGKYFITPSQADETFKYFVIVGTVSLFGQLFDRFFAQWQRNCFFGFF